jgi:hypothetical protein
VRIRTDDDVYRYRAVWLGPKGKTLPWHVRYIAYAIGFPQVLVYWLVLYGTGVFPPLTAPILAVGLAVGVTIATMWVVDHDRPVRSWLQVIRSEVDAPRTRPAREPVHVAPTFTVRTTK